MGSNDFDSGQPRRLRLSKNGFSMVEVLIALMLLGIVGFGFLMVLSNSSVHTLTANIRVTAESIARTQMEFIKSQPYDPGLNPVYNSQTLPSSQWSVDISASRLDPKGDGTLNDDGIQKIIVTVRYDRNGSWEDVLTLEGFKYSG